MLLHKWRSQMDAESAAQWVRYYAAQRQDRYGVWSGTWEEALAHPYSQESVAKWQAAREKIAEYNREIAPLEALYEEHRWSRFFLVCASNGHIHSSMSCHSCYPSTVYTWLPDLSGESEADAVAAEGEILCTFCFPSAPVAWCEGVGRRTAEAKAAAEAVKAARQAAKAEKSLSADGSVVTIKCLATEESLHGRYKDFKTYKAAELWMTEALAYKALRDKYPAPKYIGYAPDAYSVENIATVLEMMAEKKGTTVEAIAEGLAKRVAKKVADEVRYIESR